MVSLFTNVLFLGEVEKLLWNHFNPYQCIVSTDAGTVHAIDVRLVYAK